MTCYSPLYAYYSRRVNPTGKRSLVFNPREGLLDRPVDVPCGKCIGCKADQSLMWSIRAYHESLNHENNCFITLTYDDDHLPADRCIDKRHLQLFFKRLRKALAPNRIRYIACGEYGDATRRPHYHAILFGVDFLDYRKISIGNTMYTHPTLEAAWGKGQVSIDAVTMASICYTCGYVLKKINGNDEAFSLMSRRPGIGKHWLNTHLDDLQRIGKIVIEGREYTIPPRYFRWKEEELAEIKKAQTRYAKEQSEKLDPVSRRQRLDAKEVNRKSLTQQKVEKL